MRRPEAVAAVELDFPAMESLHSLDETLAALDAQVEGNYVFVSTDTVPPGLEPFAVIREAEGLTLIVKAADAFEYGLASDKLFARITPCAVTDLGAVGLTATISQTIASRGIACNVVAGFHHDHFFVPANKAQEVVGMLASLSEQARGWVEGKSANA